MHIYTHLYTHFDPPGDFREVGRRPQQEGRAFGPWIVHVACHGRWQPLFNQLTPLANCFFFC